MNRFWSAIEPLALFAVAFWMIWFTCRENLFPDPAEAADVFADFSSPVLILDSGHGGDDGGAVSQRGSRESHLNFEITSKTAAFAMLLGGEVTCTREKEEIEYPPDCTTVRARKKWDTRHRVDQISQVPEGFLLSIHQNIYSSPEPVGLQLLTGPNPGSEEFAAALFSSAEMYLPKTPLRTTATISRDVYLMNHISCPAVLCECGFLSNPEEEQRLCRAEYQREIALTLALGALHYSSGSC